MTKFRTFLSKDLEDNELEESVDEEEGGDSNGTADPVGGRIVGSKVAAGGGACDVPP